MRRFSFFLILSFILNANINAQFAGPFNRGFVFADTLSRPMRAFIMSNVPNISIFAIDRYILKEDFAYINSQTVAYNHMFTTIWDCDLFGTNLLLHPLHGNLDYNGARLNGMNILASSAYAFSASFIWEYYLEREPASFNDQIATSFAGTLLGESLFKISSSIIDESSTGAERVLREFFSAITSPMNGVERLITGRMWKKKVMPHYTESQIFDINYGIGLSTQYQKRLDQEGFKADINKLSDSCIPMKEIQENSRIQLLTSLWFKFGNIFDSKQKEMFDFFSLELKLNLSDFSNIINRVSSMGNLWKHNIIDEFGEMLALGIFQHYEYCNNKCMGYDSIPMIRYSETVSFGIGSIYQNELSTKKDKNLKLNVESFLNIVPLGAANASFYNLNERDYNYGFGYSIKNNAKLNINETLNMNLKMNFLHLFTPVGYKKDIDLAVQDIKTFYAMGDKGNTMIFTITPSLAFNFTNNCSLSINTDYFLQKNIHKQFRDINYSLLSAGISLRYNY